MFPSCACVRACVFVSPAASSSQAVNWSWLEREEGGGGVDKSSEFKAQRGRVAARVAESLREMIVIWCNQMQCVRVCTYKCVSVEYLNQVKGRNTLVGRELQQH